MKLRKFGLIGYPLSHSFSPGYFADKFERLGIANSEYKLYPLDEISKVKSLLKSGMEGINVTIPYKEQVIPYLDQLSEAAAAIGAVNTIKIVEGKSTGYNTDVYGFELSLKKACNGTLPNKALILGSGGASKAVKYVLETNKVEYLVVSRSKGDIKYEDIDHRLMAEYHLVINTTPLGMYPNIDNCPNILYQSCGANHVFYDLVYNPEKTLFLIKGAAQGAVIKNGLDMLELQAEKAWEIWNDKL